jgi:aminopeptidase-like protein
VKTSTRSDGVLQDGSGVGEAMHRLAADLFPICRSITGNGLRQTLRVLQSHIPLTLHEVATGTAVFDWTVPREWNITDAYVRNSAGQRVIDFKKSNLHVVGYSIPVRTRLSLAELKTYLTSIPEQPDAIPFRTSYFRDAWGFCLAHRQLLAMADGEYEVCIDSALTNGSLTFGECYLPGQSKDEVLISTHVCHPSLANDNLSGIVVATFLARQLQAAPRRHSYRFLFIPGTIGSITWLALNESRLTRIKHGLVLANVGDAGHLTYKKSRQGVSEVDRAALNVLRSSADRFDIRDFVPYGYDERQFCSPGIDLPVGCLSRTPHGEFPEYHTSQDDLTFLKPAGLADSLACAGNIIRVLEGNRTYLNQNPKGEPQLGRRGLYRGFGGPTEARARDMALLWVLNLSDGGHSLLDIAERSGLAFPAVQEAAQALVGCDLLRETAA